MTPADFCRIIAGSMLRLQREMFRVLHLDRHNRVVADRINWCGTADSIHVSPRAVIADARRWGAVALLFAHNHPTASAYPSEADLTSTRQLVSACAMAGVAVLDHMIVAHDGAFSMRAAGLLESAA